MTSIAIFLTLVSIALVIATSFQLIKTVGLIHFPRPIVAPYIQLQDALKALFIEMGFNRPVEANIRCELWIPKKRTIDSKSLELRKVAEFPQEENPQTQSVIKSSLQIYETIQVTRVVGGAITPIGPLGYSALSAIKDSVPTVVSEIIPDDSNLVDYMVKDWSYSEKEALKLRKDTRAFIIIPIMDSSGEELLGLLYFDARVPHAFNKFPTGELPNQLSKLAYMVSQLTI